MADLYDYADQAIQDAMLKYLNSIPDGWQEKKPSDPDVNLSGTQQWAGFVGYTVARYDASSPKSTATPDSFMNYATKQFVEFRDAIVDKTR